jgi:hypothetical protein
VVHRAIARLYERLDGEVVTHITLLVDDPVNGDTWDLDEVQEFRRTVMRKAVELDLPRVSVNLVNKSEADVVPEFVE